MENNQNKPEGKQELKKQNMALMFDGTLTKYKNENYNPMSKMASTVVNFQISFGDSMRHFCDYFLRLLPKTKQLPDVPRRYWLEHLECKVKSLVGDIALQDTKIKESYDNLVNLLNGDTTLQISKIQIDNFSNKYLNPTVTPVDSTILTQLECVFKPALEIEANLPTESEYLIARLVEDERKYIEDMEMMVKNYVEVVEAAPIWMPRTLIGHKIRLFGNIEEIFKFHKMVFYPQLLENSDSALKISKIIIIHIIGDAFEPYITFGILHKQIRSWQQQFQVFLDKVQTNCGIKYKYEPNKQLAIYQKFLQLIQKEADQQSSVEVFQKAENKIHLLLVKISNTFKIYYELQSYCLSIPVTFQIELMNMVNQKYGFDLNKPQLFIIPRDDRLYQEPLEIFELGKFVKCFQEKYKEINNPYIYTVKYYVFEHCLIYIKTDKHNNFLFGKYENFKDLKTVYLRGAPLNTRKRLVETIEKLKKCKADSLLRFELLKTKDVKEILTKIYEFNCLT